MEETNNWQHLSWEEKREERFKVWLNPPGVTFVSPVAEKLYQERVTRFIKTIKLEEPDRVPVMLPSGTFPAYYAGETFRSAMYDYEALKCAWVKFMDDFGDMDTFRGPQLIPCGRIAEVMEYKITALPGLGLPENAVMNQIIEGEYMKADEYDDLMMDPTDYHLRTMLPRTAKLFESFSKLPPLRSAPGDIWISILANPDIRETFRKLMDLADEQKKYRDAHREIEMLMLSRGYPSLSGFGLMAGAPFDHFGDTLRGIKGIVRDMFRQPQKLHEAMEFWLNVTIEKSVKNFPMNDCPVCLMPLHKGDDSFMSDKQFAEFYWPYLRRLFLAMIEEGLVPMPFAEGKYTNRLKQIKDLPRTGVMWWFDQTDMAEAKRQIGDISCIVGNLPTSVLITGTKEQVKEHCRQLIETCAPGGGYILSAGAGINLGKFENLKAMMEAAYEYGWYK